MPIFLTASSDGNNTEGIGSIVQHFFLIIGIAKKLKLEFCFEDFSNVAHWQHSNLSNFDFSKKYTDFFNFPKFPKNYKKNSFNFDNNFYDFINENANTNDNFVIEFSRDEIRKEGFKHIDYFYANKTLLSVKKNIISSFPDFEKDCLNVVIQVRRKNKTDLSNIKMWANTDGPWNQDEWREMYQTENDAHLFENKKTNFYRYINLFKMFNEKFKNVPTKFHILSEGDLEDFENFKYLILPNHEIKFHLNNHPTYDFFYSIHADCLIMANSAFSYSTGLLNFKIKMISVNFGQPCYADTIMMNKHYEIIYE